MTHCFEYTSGLLIGVLVLVCLRVSISAQNNKGQKHRKTENMPKKVTSNISFARAVDYIGFSFQSLPCEALRFERVLGTPVGRLFRVLLIWQGQTKKTKKEQKK
jgi:hypothetical protein